MTVSSDRRTGEARSQRTSRWIQYLERYGMLLVFIILFATAGLLSEHFMTARNLLNVSRQVSATGIISIGMTLVILTAGIDLAVGSTLALSAVVLARFAHLGPLAVLLALCSGMCVGLISGFFVAKVRMPPFVVTLAMLIAVRGTALLVADSHPIEGVPEIAVVLGRGRVGNVPVSALVLVLIAVLAWIFLAKTRLGRYVYAVGGNEESARLAGIPVPGVKMLVYVVSGALAAIAGMTIGGHLNVGDPQQGVGAELAAIAAVAIGGTSLGGGRGGVGSTMIGLLIVGMVSNLLNLLNVAGYTQYVISGLMIIFAVAVQRLRSE